MMAETAAGASREEILTALDVNRLLLERVAAGAPTAAASATATTDSAAGGRIRMACPFLRYHLRVYILDKSGSFLEIGGVNHLLRVNLIYRNFSHSV